VKKRLSKGLQIVGSALRVSIGVGKVGKELLKAYKPIGSCFDALKVL